MRVPRYAVQDPAGLSFVFPAHWFVVHVEKAHLLYDRATASLGRVHLEGASTAGIAFVQSFGVGVMAVAVPMYCQRDEARKVVVVWVERLVRLVHEVVGGESPEASNASALED